MGKIMEYLTTVELSERWNITSRHIRHFIVSNYIEESVLDRNPQLHTTKEDAENHGLGILSVKKVVNQYGGLIDISEENSRFMVHIACV